MAHERVTNPLERESEDYPAAQESDQGPSSAKKLKTEESSDSLEDRLTGILCCAVCLDLPKAAIYQCRNGHLMCTECFNHLLADAQLRLGTSVCPSCRTLISRDLCVRNLIVEKAVSELPMTCPKCNLKLTRSINILHSTLLCLERDTRCKYYRIGCPWTGPFRTKGDHEKRCAQPNKEGAEIIGAIPDTFLSPTATCRDTVCDYLSSERIAYNDLQLLGPYHTDEYYIRFETFRFCSFGMEWEVRAHVNNNEADPTLSSERTLSYQLLLKEAIDSRPVTMRYTIVKGPLGEMKVKPHMEEFTFSTEATESHYALLPLESSIECYRLLSGTIRFRIIMFYDDASSVNA